MSSSEEQDFVRPILVQEHNWYLDGGSTDWLLNDGKGATVSLYFPPPEQLRLGTGCSIIDSKLPQFKVGPVRVGSEIEEKVCRLMRAALEQPMADDMRERANSIVEAFDSRRNELR